jgi:hypothetical protein
MTASPLQIAVRAWTTTGKEQQRRSPDQSRKWPNTVMIFDTETTVDETQRLLFGFYRLCQWADEGSIECTEENIFCGTNLRQLDPAGYAVLQRYARANRQDTVHAVPLPLGVLSRRDFVDKVFYTEACTTRSMVVGFNLPFDLSRLAVRASNARAPNSGGFSFTLFQRWDRETRRFIENTHRPHLIIVSLDSKRAFMHFAGASKVHPDDRIPEGSTDNTPVKGYRYRGRFLDLKTLIFALTDKAHSLRSACKAFDAAELKGHAEEHGKITPEYVEYARQDVKATQALLVAARREFDRHPIDLRPDRALSPASIAKAYLGSMGITPLAERGS